MTASQYTHFCKNLTPFCSECLAQPKAEPLGQVGGGVVIDERECDGSEQDLEKLYQLHCAEKVE